MTDLLKRESQPMLIKSIEDYMLGIRKFRDNFWGINAESSCLWFRGEPADTTTPLIPKAFRGRIFEEAKEKELTLKTEFLRRTTPYLSGKGIIPSEWNLYFLMQHYGLSTRLLDWTESALIALFFTLKDENQDSIVWVLNPSELNRASSKRFLCNGKHISSVLLPDPLAKAQDYIYDDQKHIIRDNLLHVYLRMVFEGNASFTNESRFFAMAVLPSFIDERMATQQSCFTIFGKETNGILGLQTCSSFLDYMIIKRESKHAIKKDLHLLGITYSSIYPEIESVSRAIEDRYKE